MCIPLICACLHGPRARYRLEALRVLQGPSGDGGAPLVYGDGGAAVARDGDERRAFRAVQQPPGGRRS